VQSPARTRSQRDGTRRREEETARCAAIASAEEAALAAEGRYGSLREEAAAKGRKLEKLQRRVVVGGQGAG
jgi:hypothetical protein